MKNLIFLTIMYSIILSIGCNNVQNITPSPIKIADFPFKVGSHWQYLRVNSLTNFRDTVDCYITETDSLIDGNAVLLLQYEDKQGIFLEEFVRFDADTVSYYTTSGYLNNRFVFPMEMGLQYPENAPFFEVLDDDSSFNEFGHNFNKTTLIQQKKTGPNYDLLEQFHLKKNIGVVVRIIDEFDFGISKQEKWILIKYE